MVTNRCKYDNVRGDLRQMKKSEVGKGEKVERS